jgi:TadE-like protein
MTCRDGECGTSVVELTIITPLLVMFILFVVLLGRLVTAQGRVDGAARDAARAASLSRSAAGARAAATSSAVVNLGDGRVSCRQFRISADTSAFRPGGSVAVELRCTVALSDLSLLRLPGSRTVQARYVAPVDRFREVG